MTPATTHLLINQLNPFYTRCSNSHSEPNPNPAAAQTALASRLISVTRARAPARLNKIGSQSGT